MLPHHDEGSLYTIAHIVMFTGLTERTVRSHIAKGFLKGEKINGLWHFTPEQVEAFLCHPSVRPGILAKSNAVIYDFLLDGKKKTPQSCIVLDLPGDSREDIHHFFCNAICEGDFKDFHFSFDGISTSPRVILRGDAHAVVALASRFLSRQDVASHE
ncbi:MAG: helix-turn-helix domain-containing protein [Clostridia bacterium]|nr:helix-turn-helix domain-containing protein [Clostridia bacterium]